MRLLASIVVLSSAALAGIQGVLLNDDEPWFVAEDTNKLDLYKWLGGDQFGFHAGDEVALTTGEGLGRMVSSADVEAGVWVTPLSYVVGVFINDDDVWLAHTKDDKLYRPAWLGGRSAAFHVDDAVILSTSSGSGYMLRVTGSGKVAKVWIEETD